MGALRTLLNHQNAAALKGRYGRKRLRREPFGSTRLVACEFGKLTMMHPTKGERSRTMSDAVYNMIVFAVQKAHEIDPQDFTLDEAINSKVLEYFSLVFENARQQAIERRYPLI